MQGELMDRYLPDAARRPAPSAARGDAPAAAVAHLDFDMFGTHRIDDSGSPDWRAAARRIARVLRLRGSTLAALLATGLAGGAAAQTTLLNVSYDPTRELYRELDAAFNAHWQEAGHAPLDIQTSHGGSGAQAVDVVKAAGGKEIVFVCIVASPEGVATIEKAHPEIHIYTGALDRTLNAKKYILPGLGDFGDRLYGT